VVIRSTPRLNGPWPSWTRARVASWLPTPLPHIATGCMEMAVASWVRNRLRIGELLEFAPQFFGLWLSFEAGVGSILNRKTCKKTWRSLKMLRVLQEIMHFGTFFYLFLPSSETLASMV